MISLQRSKRKVRSTASGMCRQGRFMKALMSVQTTPEVLAAFCQLSFLSRAMKQHPEYSSMYVREFCKETGWSTPKFYRVASKFVKEFGE